jgi:hypothetical protein
MLKEAFLATVYKVYNEIPNDKKINPDSEYVAKYNNNKNFTESDARFLGVIEFRRENFISLEDFAFPFDKNNITFPIEGETVLIITIDSIKYWLPYSNTQYPNYREDVRISEIGKERDIKTTSTNDKLDSYNDAKGGTPNIEISQTISQKKLYKVNEKIKFLKPKRGDTLISGRVGNTIRFSEFFLTEDGKTSSPGIFIRNKQNAELDSQPIGTLIEEDINEDGTSVYITSNKIKIPFKETIKKQKIAFTKYPNSTDFTGDQLFVNSDRIVLSAKASEFIIFGKGNTGVITDGRFTIDAGKEIYAHSDKDVIFHTNKNIVLNSDASGVIYVGKVGNPGGAGSDVQRMVLAGELIDLMGELIDAITQQVYATPVGPSSAGPHNSAIFKSIKSKLTKIQSSRNFLSK